MASTTVALFALPLDDAEQLFVVLGALYLLECCWWVRGDTQRLFTGWFSRWSSLPPHSPSVATWRLTFANPVPWSESYAAERLSLALDGHRVLVPQLDPSSGGERFVSWEWDSLETVVAAGREVRSGLSLIGSYSSGSVAAAIADRLERVRSAPRGDRMSMAETVIAESWDSHAAFARLRGWRRTVWFVDALGGLLALLGLVAGPCVHAGRVLLPADLPFILVILSLGLWMATAVAGAAIPASQMPADPDARKHRWTAFLSPASAMRLADRLGRDLLAGYEPLVVALVCGHPRTVDPVAVEWLRDSVHPAFPPGVSDTSAVETLRWYQDRRAACAQRAVVAAGFDPGTWLGAPTPDRDAVAYCPRCHRQFVDTTAVCCGCGVETKPVMEP